MKFFKRKNNIKKERDISELSIDEITYEICLEAIKSRPGDIIYVPTEYRTKELCELAVELRPENIEYVTNTRQQSCLSRAKLSLEQALLGARVHELQDLIFIDVKSSLLALDELTGELITDEILDNIFDNFCIGK